MHFVSENSLLILEDTPRDASIVREGNLLRFSELVNYGLHILLLFFIHHRF